MLNRHTADIPAPAPLPAEKLLSRIVGRPVTITSKNPTSLRTLHEALATLSDREAHVLRLRFGLEYGQDRTLAEIGEGLNITRERVRQIEAKALRKLAHPNRFQSLEALIEINTY